MNFVKAKCEINNYNNNQRMNTEKAIFYTKFFPSINGTSWVNMSQMSTRRT